MIIKTKTALHEHLGTRTYRGGFDKVVDIAYERLGPGGIFSVVSIADDRLPGDKRYEKFVDSGKKSKYSLVDLSGRATYVEDKDLLIVNGIEAEIREGSILLTGLERDNDINAGNDVDHSSLFAQVRGKDIFSFMVHPFF